jgi:glycosyltransferase involved in cell wall biosynthesis
MNPENLRIENLGKYEYVFLMISRLNWKSVWNDIKGNDKFIRSYARYIKNHRSNSVLLLPRKGIDLDATVDLVNELNIKENVIFFDDMPKYELACYQKMENVIVVDNFWHDDWYKRYPEQKSNVKVGFGFGSIESLAMGRPLITAFKDIEFYDNQVAPILYAFSEEEIYLRIAEVHTMSRKELTELGAKGYEFVKKWHEQTTLIKIYENELQEIIKMKKRNGI